MAAWNGLTWLLQLYGILFQYAFHFDSIVWLPTWIGFQSPRDISFLPASGNVLWYLHPGTLWSRDYLPVGNGHLGAMTGGGTFYEALQLNIESLWTGGPFEDPLYNGGNKDESEREWTAEWMKTYRDDIFRDGAIPGIQALGTPGGAYGSYSGAGHLVTVVNDSSSVTTYRRWLDLDDGVAKTSWSMQDQAYTRSTFCSASSGLCTQHLNASALPLVTFAFSSSLEAGLPRPNVSCVNSNVLSVRGRLGQNDNGILYELVFKAFSSQGGDISCTDLGDKNATLSVTGGPREIWVSWAGDTEYNIDAGDEEHGFSFQGPDPHSKLVAQVESLQGSFLDELALHIKDIRAALWDHFSLDLGQRPNLDQPTDELMASYTKEKGNPYIEWLLFNYGRYLLACSARGTLPANLQGVWADGYTNSWSADYHANINVQMNYWIAESTGMDVVKPLFDYMEKTWVPRGSKTSRILYNSRGWVTHSEMNIFGHTGMKEGASAWANYPESAVWMMLHVWDHFDFTGDIEWFKRQGWPPLKGTALFQLDKLLDDGYFKDGTLVVAPCCSPEQEYITFGCAHAQQLIWQLLNAIVKGFEYSGDTDVDFLKEVLEKRDRLDLGIKIGSWGQLQEWKIDHDRTDDTHRHLSHLIGLYPGYAITSYEDGLTEYSKEEVLEATRVSLEHRGNGTGPDADAGWEKAWRAACWAQLADAERFYSQLKYSIERDFGSNLFSLYDPASETPFFQIDANLGYPAAVLNAIVQTPDVADEDMPFVVSVLPALPDAWSEGSVRGVRGRHAMSIDLKWSSGELKEMEVRVGSTDLRPRSVQIHYKGRVISAFETGTESLVTFKA
ncbi:glycoside hydrolase family 95 protein [Cylindrobasidium torrendii FP15055 ss-10]|uniref:Glycoside hydrolase family 95 protein n=1 Tax=Cylindrobasidium torrendii FP15055 ss-10 TaxID=1314674 RepID=A0A0D7AZI0_9AGAR|nr:glycoside hydrolase family 95 protein [Cylindrobasidium torrendii FP15055 ss-10]